MSRRETAIFKVHNPTGRKFRRTREMQNRYNDAWVKAIGRLTAADSEVIESFRSSALEKAKGELRSLLKDTPLNGPMWDGLVTDVQNTISTALSENEGDLGGLRGVLEKPVVDAVAEGLGPVYDKDRENLPDALKEEGEKDFENRERPITFVRFEDNPIIRSEDGEKLWIAPYFQEREDGKTGALPPSGVSIREVWSYSTESDEWNKQQYRETFPLELSRWHMHRFFGDGTPEASKIHVLGKEIFVYYAFSFSG